jgi:protoporphyrinogen oxidase
MLGLAVAKHLARAGHRVTVFEGEAAPGGLARPAAIGDHVWDRFYHVILSSDTSLLGLLDELGLADRLRWRPARTGFYVDGVLHSLTTALDFARFPPLSLLDKARLATTILHASRIRDGRPLESIPVEVWLTRWSGRRAFDRLWRPLLQAKLGANYREASASFIWAIIARMYAARRAGLKQELFGYVDGGYAEILPRFRAQVEGLGVAIRTGERVTAVRSVDRSAMVARASGTSAFDRAVLTVPCGRVAELCPELTPEERDRLRTVTYQGVICASLLLRRPLAGYYITNIAEPEIPFTAVIEMTALVEPARFGGRSLVYVPWYLVQDDPRWAESDEAVIATSLAGLRRIYPHIRDDDLVTARVARAREVLAISTLNYSARLLPPVWTTQAAIQIVNSAQIANGTLNVNETLALARVKTTELLAGMTRGAGQPVGV